MTIKKKRAQPIAVRVELRDVRMSIRYLEVEICTDRVRVAQVLGELVQTSPPPPGGKQ